MNKTLTTTLAVLAILVLAGVIFWAGTMHASIDTFGTSRMFRNGWHTGSGIGFTMRDRRGPGMMDADRNMMPGYGYNNANLSPLTVEQVKAAADTYLTNLDSSDLEIAEIMIFDNNGYVTVKEASTGIGAFELLVDPGSQTAYPEHGPNMMWNLKFRGLNHMNMMGGYPNMMGNWGGTTSLDTNSEMTITPEQALEYAQEYLDANIAGATVEHPVQFYGYYTLDFEKDGKVAGMLSVNGFNGQVFPHTWHGKFIEETEYE